MIRAEFIGIPGSGKSFIRNKLLFSLKNLDKDMYMSMEEAMLVVSKVKMDKVYRMALKCLPDSISIRLLSSLMGRTLMQFESQNKFLAKNGRSLESFLSSKEFDDLSIEDRENVIGGYVMTGSAYECLLNGPLPDNAVVFFEEGLIQKSLMFVSHVTSDYADAGSVNKYLNNIPPADLLIYVETDLETCYERMTARSQGLTNRLKKVDEKGIKKFLEASDTHLRRVVDWVENEGNTNLLRVDNNMNINTVIENLQNSIIQILDRDN